MPDDYEYLIILENNLQNAKKQKEEAIQNYSEIEKTVDETIQKVGKLQSELKTLKRKFIFDVENDIDDEHNVSLREENLNTIQRSTAKKRQVRTEAEIEDEVAEVFTENDTSAAVAPEDVELCKQSQFE